MGARLDIIIDVRANIYTGAPLIIDVARQYIDVRASIIIWARTSI